MIDYYRSNIVTECFRFLSPSLSQILAARLILCKMADSSATTAVGAQRNQVKQSPSSKVKQHNVNVLGELKTTYSLGKEENGHVFFRSYVETLKAIEQYEVKTAHAGCTTHH